MGWSRDGLKVHFGRGDFKTFLSFGGKELPVSGMNSIPPLGGIGVFTPDVWSYITGAPTDGWEVTVKGGIVSGVRHASSLHVKPLCDQGGLPGHRPRGRR